MKKIDEKLAAEISQKKPAVSNSRLGSLLKGKLEISIDRITVVGDLKKDQSKNLNRELKFNSYVQLYETGEERFKADIPNICHVEYDFLKGKSLDRKNMRVEFNPNNLNDEHKQMIYDLFISKMVSRSFSRLDVAFDTDIDLSSYYAYMSGQHAQMKKTIFYGKDGSPETKYFGTRKSDRYIRIYNKKQELLDNKEIEIESDHFWRIEVELKRSRTEEWKNCLQSLNFVQPDWKSIERNTERAMVYMLIHEEDEWGNLNKNIKSKYRKLLKEISPVNLTDDLNHVLNQSYQRIQSELDFWLGE